MADKKNGLTDREAIMRLKKYGKNEIKRKHKLQSWKIFLRQFSSPLVIILIFAAGVSILIGYLPGQKPNFVDGILILVIVAISSVAGFFQEYKAERSIEMLQAIAMPQVETLRNGEIKKINIADIVPGDIVFLSSGDVVPADAQIIQAFDLKVDESVITGESKSVRKKVGDKLWKGSSIYIGSTKIEITATGLHTEIGKIADKLQKIKKEKTTFEKEIALLSKKIFWGVGLITLVIVIVSLTKYGLYISLLTGISLAVAAIPEGLPAVVVLALTVGAKVMFKQHVLVRKLAVVESVGAVDVVCTDKTGTLTKNEMTAMKMLMNGKEYQLSELKPKSLEVKEIFLGLKCAILCNDTKISGYPKTERKYLGGQTEISLIKIGEQVNLFKEKLELDNVRIDEVAFSSERKMMSVMVEDKNSNKYYVYSKGAPEILLEKCNRLFLNGEIKKINAKDKAKILEYNQRFASQALRVLGLAYKPMSKTDQEIEKKLVWLGLIALIDPPHDNVARAIDSCRRAGIRIIMITGDNKITAKAIADSIGLATKEVLTGQGIDKMSDKVLSEHLNRGVNIFARTTAFHKLRILEILSKEHRLAMTGDGINDALALKRANVGIAMGQKGTSVAKESSDMVLLDDNFANIVKAIREGRRIFDNIKKFINYLFVSNIAEVMVIFIATLFFTLERPILLPVQILWVNLLTDGLPALALGVDPAREDILDEPPRPKSAKIIDQKMTWLIGLIGLKKTFILIITFLLLLPLGEAVASTALFTGFILYEFVRIAVIRYQEKLGWLANPWLVVALIGSILLQLLIIYTPLNIFFHTVPLGLYAWFILISGVVVGYFLAIFITKIIITKLKA